MPKRVYGPRNPQPTAAESADRFAEAKFLQYVHRGYFNVDLEGRIWRLRERRRGRMSARTWSPVQPRRAETQCGDYLAVKITLHGKQHAVMAHRIVYLVLKGAIPAETPIINHEDGIKTNNHPDNLTLATYQSNAIHARDVLGVGPWTKKIMAPIQEALAELAPTAMLVDLAIPSVKDLTRGVFLENPGSEIAQPTSALDSKSLSESEPILTAPPAEFTPITWED